MMLPDRLTELFSYSEHECDGEMVWVLGYRWHRHPFKLVDWRGVGHDDAGCGRIHVNGETLDPLMARDPWPCKSCVQTPAPNALQGTFVVPGGPGKPSASTEPYGPPGSPMRRLAATFGTV